MSLDSQTANDTPLVEESVDVEKVDVEQGHRQPQLNRNETFFESGLTM